MLLSSDRKFTSILGTTVDAVEISRKDKTRRKKYMGMRRVGCTVTMKMRRFPMMVKVYIKQNVKNSKCCSSGWLDNPERTNAVSRVWFPGSGPSVGFIWEESNGQTVSGVVAVPDHGASASYRSEESLGNPRRATGSKGATLELA